MLNLKSSNNFKKKSCSKCKNLDRKNYWLLKENKYLSVYSLGIIHPKGVEIKRGSSSVLMSYGNRFAQLTTEAAESAARLVLSQLSERLSFSKHPSNNDEEMECLQFGICSYQVQPQRVNF